MGRKAIRQEVREKEAALKHAENTIKELKTTVNAKNHEIKELQNLLNSDDLATKELKELLSNEARESLDRKNAEIAGLQASLNTKARDLEQEIGENEKIKKQMQTKGEELTALLSVMNEKDKQSEKLNEALKNKEQEVENRIRDKDIEIGEIKTSLMAAEKELQTIQNGTF
jgi:chromosome segregation ATPase